MEERYIPKYLNAQPQILWWDLDAFIVLMVFTGIGLVVDHQFAGAIAGLIAMKVYTKLKSSKNPGFIRHVAYAFGFFGLKEKVPEFWVKEIVK